MTTLDAVKAILKACGQRPPSAAGLETGSYTMVGNAEAVLDEASRKIQARGWFFNTRREVELTPDGSDNIAEPTGALSVVPRRDYASRRIARINGLLFDVDNNTDEFDGPVTVDYVFEATFSEIPSVIADYIVAEAAIEFNVRFVKNLIIDQNLRIRRAEAKTIADQLDGDEERTNVFDTPEARRLRGRRMHYSLTINP